MGTFCLESQPGYHVTGSKPDLHSGSGEKQSTAAVLKDGLCLQGGDGHS